MRTFVVKSETNNALLNLTMCVCVCVCVCVWDWRWCYKIAWAIIFCLYKLRPLPVKQGTLCKWGMKEENGPPREAPHSIVQHSERCVNEWVGQALDWQFSSDNHGGKFLPSLIQVFTDLKTDHISLNGIVYKAKEPITFNVGIFNKKQGLVNISVRGESLWFSAVNQAISNQCKPSSQWAYTLCAKKGQVEDNRGIWMHILFFSFFLI